MITNIKKQVYADVADVIEDCAEKFWCVFANRFPELTSGDSQLSGEDKAAFGIWFVGDCGPNNCVVKHDSSMCTVNPVFTNQRIFSCVCDGAEAALKDWLDAGMQQPESQHLPHSIAIQLEYCLRHVLWANDPFELSSGK
jgi:hypothetical protein